MVCARFLDAPIVSRGSWVFRNFRFAGYLKKCEQEVVLEMAEVKESVWAGFILAVGVELYIKGIMGDAEDKDVSCSFERWRWRTACADIPGMCESGFWFVWPDGLQSLKEYKDLSLYMHVM